jgi:hypothetical protein
MRVEARGAAPREATWYGDRFLKTILEAVFQGVGGGQGGYCFCSSPSPAVESLYLFLFLIQSVCRLDSPGDEWPGGSGAD